jgi:dTMP kinase
MGVKAKFITFEGSEGSGKSTQARKVYNYLKRKKKDVLFIREPGGVKISEAIRRVLLDVKNVRMTKECETLLYMAARDQLVDEIIQPALKKGQIVLCDRFLDSTIVYQGYGFGVDLKFIKFLGRFVTDGICPDLTLLFDIDIKEGLSRKGKIKDRIERRTLVYHQKVRAGYRQIAKRDPGRVKLVEVTEGKEEIWRKVKVYIDKLFDF